MHSTIIFTLFAAFYLCYNLQPKINIAENNKVLIKLRDSKRTSYILAVLLMVVAFSASLYCWGIGSGTFAYFAVLMGVGCMIVLLAPFRYLKWRHVLLLYILSFILEINL